MFSIPHVGCQYISYILITFIVLQHAYLSWWMKIQRSSSLSCDINEDKTGWRCLVESRCWMARSISGKISPALNGNSGLRSCMSFTAIHFPWSDSLSFCSRVFSVPPILWKGNHQKLIRRHLGVMRPQRLQSHWFIANNCQSWFNTMIKRNILYHLATLIHDRSESNFGHDHSLYIIAKWLNYTRCCILSSY